MKLRRGCWCRRGSSRCDHSKLARRREPNKLAGEIGRRHEPIAQAGGPRRPGPRASTPALVCVEPIPVTGETVLRFSLDFEESSWRLASAVGKLVEVIEHLDDHSLQQFVTYQTNQPVRLHYEAFRFEDKDVGIIRIDLTQNRPIYLNRDFGPLKAREVYVRRGSSTDPKNPASPKEIAEMGRSATVIGERPELRVQFAEIERDLAIGEQTAWEAVNVSVRQRKTSPTSPPALMRLG